MKPGLDNTKCTVILFFFFLLSCHAVKNSSIITPGAVQNLVDTIRYYPLQNEDDLDVLIKEIGDARVVLLGESTHGTHEYYTWRTAITKKLIQEKGFDFMAIEGDWTDSYKINRFIREPVHDSAAVIEALKQYDRWPSSMWSNYEMVPL